MDLSDIQYLIELLESSIHSQDWDSVQEALEFLRETAEESVDDDDDQD
jgi:hypothetical protein